MEMKKNLFESLDPEIIDRVTSRRNAVETMGRFGLGLAVASVPIAFGALTRNAFGQSQDLPQDAVDVLNFALTLERLESAYYDMGVKASNLIPAEVQDVYMTIADDEKAHVSLLEGVLGSKAGPMPTFDFTAGGKFTPFSDYAQFLILSQGFEDLGVRAYKGQAPNLMPYDELLLTALRIHSVEARHAAIVRRIRGKSAWITGNMTDAAPIEPIYMGEDKTEQLGVDVVSVSGLSMERVSEAFDEPLAKDDVLSIAGMFIQS